MVPRCLVSDNVKAEVCLNRTCQTMWMATLEVCFYKKGPRRVYLSNRCNDTHFQAVFPWHIKTDNCAKRKNSLSEKYNPCLLSYLCTPVKVGMFVQFLVSKSSKIFGYSNNNSYQKGFRYCLTVCLTCTLFEASAGDFRFVAVVMLPYGWNYVSEQSMCSCRSKLHLRQLHSQCFHLWWHIQNASTPYFSDFLSWLLLE